MMKVVKAAVFVAGMLGLSAAYAADVKDVKIGVLDVQQIMQQSPQVAQLNKQLQDQFKPRQEKILAAQKNLQDELDQLNKNAAVMKEADKTKLQDKIIADKASYQAMAQSFQQDLANAQNQAMQKFMGNLQAAVDKVAKQNQYTMVVNRAAVPYLDPSVDITKQVLADMSK